MRPGAFEVVGAQATAPGAAYAAVVVNTGNSLQVRNCPSGAFLLDMWVNAQGALPIARITSPRLHDNVNGINPHAVTAVVSPLNSRYPQALVAQDTLTAALQGSAVAGDIEILGFNVYYPNLPGSNGVLINPQELQQYGSGMVMTFTNTVATGAAGDWSGAAAINSVQDQFKANRWYAILGYDVQTPGNQPGSVQYVGPDFGNLGVGGPGSAALKGETRNYFLDLSTKYGVPVIPVFNAANKGATTLAVHQDENGANPLVTTWCVLLKEEFNPDLLA